VVDSAGRIELCQPLCFGVEQYKSPDLEFVFGHTIAPAGFSLAQIIALGEQSTKKAPRSGAGPKSRAPCAIGLHQRP
jgi:hypothetical protein